MRKCIIYSINLPHTPGVGALLHVDRPHVEYYLNQENRFIYLDADLLCVGDPWEAFAFSIMGIIYQHTSVR